MRRSTPRSRARCAVRIVLVTCLALMCGACRWTDGGFYRIEWSIPTSHLNFTNRITGGFEYARVIYFNNDWKGMEVIRQQVGVSSPCYASGNVNASYECVMRLIRKGGNLDGRMGAYFDRWTDWTSDDKVGDYTEAHKNALRRQDRCLVSSFNPATMGANNWTYRTVGTSECRWT